MHRQKNQKLSSRNKTLGSDRTKVSNYGGVYPIPIYTKPNHCGGYCIYCPKSGHLPNSYIQNEDTAFALNVNYSPERQLIRHIQQIEASEGYGIPLEIIILGGSFSSYTKIYRKDFISRLYNCMQGLHSMNKERGIPSEYLCSILTIESRPDQINKNECNFLRSIGVSKVEIGVQHVSDTILKKVNRGHSVRDVIRATYQLKSFGFKVGYHVMIGLPGSTHQDDVRMLKESLWKPELSPDFLKIYPCELLKNRTYQPKLWDLYNQKKWHPLTKKYIYSVLNESIPNIPKHVRISRITRQFRNKDVIQRHAFGLHDNLKGKCKCIRCREVGKSASEKNIFDFDQYIFCIKTIERDIIIEVKTKNDILLALARVYKIVNSKYILREIHVYGKSRSLGTAPHIQGGKIGSNLLNFIENFLLQRKAEIMLINAAPGARGFFQKRGYKIHSDGYLKKPLLPSQPVKNADRNYHDHGIEQIYAA